MAEPTKIYFGYGSNLWIDQMNRRCPQNVYIGVALLNDWLRFHGFNLART